MDDLTPDTDIEIFARALYGWMGPRAVTYAEERAKTVHKAGDLKGSKAWSRVAQAAGKYRDAGVRRGRTALRK